MTVLRRMGSGHEVTRHVLENGLVVLLKEVHSAPLISFWVFYRVGSRNEQTGQTGVSHWVEHMMFKGTPRYPAGVLDREIDRNGGIWNAQTSFDYTAYYETLPADRIDLAIEAEADRMVNALFDPEETESERTVIISERQGSENSPMFWLNEEVQGMAFRVHPYHHTIIGDMADLETMTRDDLYHHYRRYYAPNNAIVVVVGAFASAEMLEKVKAVYGGIHPGDAPPPVVRKEPPQMGERRVNVERPGSTAFIEVMYRAPAVSNPDWFAFAALDSILGGPSGPGGGNIDNKTSRLYRGVVETGIAASASGHLYMTSDPFGYTITLAVNDDRTLEEAEAALDAVLDGLKTNPITQKELDKAKKQAKAAFAYATEGVTGQAYWLGYAEMLDSYTLFTDFVSRLEAVTLEQVQQVAEQYLRPSQRTLGRFIPQMENEAHA
ncbi:MAG: insulinase family protein [Anaerolineae bacterium]|nr:MAG: insulinase family protein [Anaerolineae bacterium]